MKAVIDSDLCTGCGFCVDACPEVFELIDDIAEVIVDEIPEGQEDNCQAAAEDCPASAITIE